MASTDKTPWSVYLDRAIKSISMKPEDKVKGVRQDEAFNVYDIAKGAEELQRLDTQEKNA